VDGIGEDVQPDVAMGLMSYTVPVPLPSGHAGTTPTVRLSYSSGAGNSVAGIGWALDVPCIERMTVHGLPRYSPEDRFAADHGRELVYTGDMDYTRLYRERFEGSFVRYRWMDPKGDGRAGFWKAEYPDGTVSWFGADATGAAQPDAQVRSESGAFRYLVVESVDVLGHSIRYQYEKAGLCRCSVGSPMPSPALSLGTKSCSTTGIAPTCCRTDGRGSTSGRTGVSSR
jgi:hypothetical protein